MKKILVGIIVLSSIIGCKKGANDPLFSVKSRTARLKGDWKVETAVWASSDTTWTLENGNITRTDSSGNSSSIPTVLSYTFTDKGEYSFITETTYPEDFVDTTLKNVVCIATESGIWNFTGGAGATKTKSQLLLQVGKTESSCGNQPSNINTVATEGQLNGFIYNIDKLTDKVIVLKYNEKVISPGYTIIKTAEIKLVR